jgi:Big-like domain-containing protein/VCBS repeat protein
MRCHRLVLSLFAAALLRCSEAPEPQRRSEDQITGCTPVASIAPIPDMRLHVGFPVDYTARASITESCGLLSVWGPITGANGLTVDGAGGLFYWTPDTPGTFTITLGLSFLDPSTGSLTLGASTTFLALVDDDTIIDPLFRDYRSEAAIVPITGRAHGTDFVSYALSYAAASAPSVAIPIVGPVTTPVTTTARLADWDISALPDGGRYLLKLEIELSSGGKSVLTDPVIIDRTAKPGWPKRIGPITHSVVLADLDDDGREEVLAVTHFGELYAWRISGELLFHAKPGGATYSGPSVGDIDGDGRPEIVWATIYALYAHRADGSLVPGFPLSAPSGREFRTIPTLADLDGDGRLEILLGEQGSDAHLGVYRYSAGSLAPLPGWPQPLPGSYASVSVGDLDGDGRLEIVAESFDRAYAWHADGSPVLGLHGAALVAPIVDAHVNGAGSIASSAQPALADLDGDGRMEVIIGPNVLHEDGSVAAGWSTAKTGAVAALSAAIGDLDPAVPGLEVVLGAQAWHPDGSPVPGRPLPVSLSSASLGDCGDGGLTTMAGSRNAFAPNIDAFEPEGVRTASYPKSLYGETGDVGAPVTGDFDSDGRVDVAAAITDANYGGIVAVYGTQGANYDEHHEWPMLGHDVRHSGRYSPPPPNRPTRLAASVGAAGVQLSWVDQSGIEDRYAVERSATGAPYTFVRVATLLADTTAYSDPNASGTVSYRVRAERRDPRTGEWIASHPSNCVQATIGASADVIAPTIAIISPADGTKTRSSRLSVLVAASDNVAVIRVLLYVDGVLAGSSTTPPFTTVWDARSASRGAHTLQCQALDAAGNRGTSRSITVFRR